MKKLTITRYFFKVNKNIKNWFLAILIAIILYSCTSQDEPVNHMGISKTEIKSKKNETIGNVLTGLPISELENLNSFSKQIFINSQSLDIALNKNQSVEFNEQLLQMLNTATNENDLNIIFTLAGITNSQEVIDILKSNVALKRDFINQNPNFYNLTIDKRIELLNTSYELVETNYFITIPLPSSGLEAKHDCRKILNRDRNRCQRDFSVCTMGALATATIPPFWPGLIVEVLCAVDKINCEKDAVEDYKECIPQEIPGDGPPPATGELTLHCTHFRSPLDSCWTTDSNGKYVGRVN